MDLQETLCEETSRYGGDSLDVSMSHNLQSLEDYTRQTRISYTDEE